MERQLGISKIQKKMSNKDRIEAMQKNIIHGNKLQAEMKETRRLQEQSQTDKDSAAKISSRATHYMVNDSLSYIEAYAKAKEDIEGATA